MADLRLPSLVLIFFQNAFLGVDLNYAPIHILKKVSGLGNVTAKAIVDYRAKNGSFANRNELKKVKGIGEKTFQQCAGFVRIYPDKM